MTILIEGQKDVTDRAYRIVYRYPNWRKMPAWCRETHLYSDDLGYLQREAEKLINKNYKMVVIQSRDGDRWTPVRSTV